MRAPRILGIVVLGSLAIAVLDCREPTQLEVIVTTDVACARVKETSIASGELATLETRDPSAVSDRCSGNGDLGSVVIVPTSDRGAEVGIRVVAGIDGKTAQQCVETGYGGSCIVARRSLRFIPHTPLRVPIRLEASCVDHPCSANTTCRGGACVSAVITCAEDGTCTDPLPSSGGGGSWSTLPAQGLSAGRADHAAFASGKELWIWAGDEPVSGAADSGLRFASGAWSSIPGSKLAPRYGNVATFTGTEIVFWGGLGGLSDGARFAGTSWTTLSDPKAVPALASFAGRDGATVVWEPVSKRVVVWGGFDKSSVVLKDGALYDPATNSWSPMSASPLSERGNQAAVAVGGKVILFGGECGGPCTDGAIYDPSTDKWSNPFSPPMPPRSSSLAVTDGTRAIFYGGEKNEGGEPYGDVLFVTPAGVIEAHTGSTGAPAARANAAGFFANGRLYVWGGRGATGLLGDGGIYDPATDRWTAMSPAGAPSPRRLHTMTWMGANAIIFGGDDAKGNHLGDGAIFTP